MFMAIQQLSNQYVIGWLENVIKVKDNIYELANREFV